MSEWGNDPGVGERISGSLQHSDFHGLKQTLEQSPSPVAGIQVDPLLCASGVSLTLQQAKLEPDPQEVGHGVGTMPNRRRSGKRQERAALSSDTMEADAVVPQLNARPPAMEDRA